MATLSLDAAAAAMREAMRDTVRRNSLLYLLQGILMVITGLPRGNGLKCGAIMQGRSPRSQRGGRATEPP